MNKEHCNLFYIFQRDHAAHSMPPHFLERLQQVLSNMFSPEKEKSEKISKK